MGAEFRLLGDVEVRVDGRSIELGSRKQRSVLAVLLAEANHVVPAENLIERVWGDDVPPRARGTLASYVSRLRTALSPAGVAVVRKDPGYVLQVEPRQVDLHEFRDLVAEVARDRNGSGETLRRALGAWHGTPLNGLDTAWAVRLRQALQHERLAVELDLVDARLAAGEHAALLPELFDRAGLLRWDERVAAQLMLALYRSDRPADALAQYQRIRVELVDQLGADPGPSLQRLQQQILARDSALDLNADQQAPAGRARPRQLPPDLAEFVGREEPLAELRKLVARGSRAIAIRGTAGVGKTALAVHFAQEVADSFPDGQLFIDLRGYSADMPMNADNALGRLLRSLGTTPERVGEDAQEWSAAVRTAVAGRRMLVVLDNARTADQVRPLLPGTAGCLVLITSRAPLTAVDGVTHVRLDRFDERESHLLLEHAAGPGRLAAEPRAAATLVGLCARLPLALRIAGARLAARPGWTAGTLQRRISDARHPLSELESGDRAVRASFAVSYESLRDSDDPVERSAARLFRVLGVIDFADITVPIASALLDTTRAAAQAALEQLVDDQLLDSAVPGRYRGHDLLRQYARELSETEPAIERHAALVRILECYVALADRVNRSLGNTSDSRLAGKVIDERYADISLDPGTNVSSWIEAEAANVHSVIHAGCAAEPPAPGLAVMLIRLLHYSMDACGRWADTASLNQLAIDTSTRCGDRLGAAFAWNDLAWSYFRMARTEDSVVAVNKALAIYRDLGLMEQVVLGLGTLALLYVRKRRFEEASAVAHEAVTQGRTHGSPVLLASNLNTLGVAQQRLGATTEAVASHREAVAIAHDVGHRYGETSSLCGLGWAYSRSGDHVAARACFEQSLAIAKTHGFRFPDAEACWGIGISQYNLGDRAAARASWDRSIALLLELGEITPAEADKLTSSDVPETPAVIERNT